MSVLRTKKQPTTNNNKSNSTTTTTVSTPCQQLALSIPEVLERILSFLTLNNRQEAARFVCKQWYATCKDLVLTTHNWVMYLTPRSTVKNTNSYREQITRDLIASAHSINIRVEKTGASHTERSRAWVGMMDTFSSVIREQDDRRENLRLRILHLKEGVIWKLVAQLPLLPSLATLSTLRIDMTAMWDIIHLFTIFKACPNLEELSVKPSLAAVKFRNSLPDAVVVQEQNDVLTSSQEHALISGTNALPALTRLRTSIFYDITVTQPALTAFLQAYKDIIGLLGATQEYGDQGTSIIHLVSAHCPDIKTFHLSMARRSGGSLTSQEVVALLESFPQLEECHLTDEMFCPNLLMSLDTAELTNRITTLNLLPVTGASSPATNIPLREILCSFEHLVHLRAPTAVYYAEDMDIHGVLTQLNANRPGRNYDNSHAWHSNIPTRDPVEALGYVWVCRGLKTLHMTIGHRSPRNRQSAETSLMIFGFLSRMAPRLQELSLKSHVINMTFEGGLALLTRLRDLERLRLVFDRCPWWMTSTMSWMDPTRPSKWERLVYPLQRSGLRKKLWEPYNSISRSQEGTNKSALVKRGRDLGMDLSWIGYPDDLLEWIDDRHRGPSTTTTTTTTSTSNSSSSSSSSMALPHQSKDEQVISSWPKLESFLIEVSEERSKSFFRKAEAFMEKVRPDINAQLCLLPQDDFYLTTLQHY
ncbi:hypothetical protein BGZ96_004523 [Linnemannia gamsii]|uniref:F-box domain-containing protein n=1 Tax=Linnemannia gamsii TaxID=64522 RepID=A0ABQ7K703_9FUNG|nr:hypothetical protein BGZ96_004523 [Linnemannia gamsii]